MPQHIRNAPCVLIIGRQPISRDCAFRSENKTMKIILSAIGLLTMIVTGQARNAVLTDAEATFLNQLVTAAAVLAQRCNGYEADGTGAVRLGARLLGSTDAAMEMIAAFDAAIKAHDGNAYDAHKFRPEVFAAASETSRKLRAGLIKDPKGACYEYGNISVAHGLLRRY